MDNPPEGWPAYLRDTAKCLLETEDDATISAGAVLLAASFLCGPDLAALQVHTGLPPRHIARIAYQLRRAGIWSRSGEMLIPWRDFEPWAESVVEFVLHALVAVGEVSRYPNGTYGHRQRRLAMSEPISVDFYDRDYDTEFDAFLADECLSLSDHAPAAVAADLVRKAQELDWELLLGWLDLRAEEFVARELRRRKHVQDVRAAKEDQARVFSDAARRHTDGDEAALHPFRFTLVVNARSERRCVAEMTRADHLFIARQYVDAANAAKFEAAFHTAVAKRIPEGKTTADVMDEATYVRLRDSMRPASLGGRRLPVQPDAPPALTVLPKPA